MTIFKNTHENKKLFEYCQDCIDAVLNLKHEIGREEKEYSMDLIEKTNLKIHFVLACIDDHELEHSKHVKIIYFCFYFIFIFFNFLFIYFYYYYIFINFFFYFLFFYFLFFFF